MSRYIDADKLIERLKKDPLYSLVERYGITGVIEHEPTADVAEIKRGRWVEEERPTCYVYRCTACGDEFDAPYNYCPNCGATMVDVDEVEE